MFEAPASPYLVPYDGSFRVASALDGKESHARSTAASMRAGAPLLGCAMASKRRAHAAPSFRQVAGGLPFKRHLRSPSMQVRATVS